MLKSGLQIASHLRLLHHRSGRLTLKIGESLSTTVEGNGHFWTLHIGQLNIYRHSHSNASADPHTGYKIQNNIADCYKLLGINEDNSESELREAYLNLAKIYHPDSGTSTADPRKFSQIQEAYKAIKKHRTKDDTEVVEDEDEMIFDIKHTVPQHRQYLSFEGVGFGTPGQRQKQYQQYKVSKATEKVYQHRVEKWAAKTEDALVVKTKTKARKAKISSGIERLVEDLIQEAMQKGDFDNLPGTGKPLNYSDRNPMVDTMTHNLNKILINDGFAPGWIMLEKEIRDNIRKARGRLAGHIKRYGLPPFESRSEKERWTTTLDNFTKSIEDVNAQIYKFNMTVPIVEKQLIPLTVTREIRRVKENVDKYYIKSYEVSIVMESNIHHTTDKKTSLGIGWREIWKNIKDVFR